jgi:hypothetical protein
MLLESLGYLIEKTSQQLRSAGIGRVTSIMVLAELPFCAKPAPLHAAEFNQHHLPKASEPSFSNMMTAIITTTIGAAASSA